MKSRIKILISHRITLSNLLLMLSLVTVTGNAFASTTWYVDGVKGNDSNNCKSPTTACRTIGHAIALASSGDSIRVAAATYTENLTIGISLNVLGVGASTTIIDGAGGGYSVVLIYNPSANVTLSGMTIRNGVAAQRGGGISNGGTLTINNSTVSGNTAVPMGCFPFCSYGGSGGGIYNDGRLTINKSTVSGNGANYGCRLILYPRLHFFCTGGDGGGIYSVGTLRIYNSTVSGNVAMPGSSSGFGGGIYNGGTLTVSNSTISGNSTYQGGGIYGSAALQNSIVAHSPGGNCSGTMTSKGYNLSSDNTCNFSNSGDRNNIDPKLGPLQNNGGPTQTMALLPGSPAIDAGNPSGCTDGAGHLLRTDQRGLPRPDKEDKLGCDTGAYERQSQSD